MDDTSLLLLPSELLGKHGWHRGFVAGPYSGGLAIFDTNNVAVPFKKLHAVCEACNPSTAPVNSKPATTGVTDERKSIKERQDIAISGLTMFAQGQVSLPYKYSQWDKAILTSYFQRASFVTLLKTLAKPIQDLAILTASEHISMRDFVFWRGIQSNLLSRINDLSASNDLQTRKNDFTINLRSITDNRVRRDRQPRASELLEKDLTSIKNRFCSTKNNDAARVLQTIIDLLVEKSQGEEADVLKLSWVDESRRLLGKLTRFYTGQWLDLRKQINNLPSQCRSIPAAMRKVLQEYLQDWNDFINKIKAAVSYEEKSNVTAGLDRAIALTQKAHASQMRQTMCCAGPGTRTEIGTTIHLDFQKDPAAVLSASLKPLRQYCEKQNLPKSREFLYAIYNHIFPGVRIN